MVYSDQNAGEIVIALCLCFAISAKTNRSSDGYPSSVLPAQWPAVDHSQLPVIESTVLPGRGARESGLSCQLVFECVNKLFGNTRLPVAAGELGKQLFKRFGSLVLKLGKGAIGNNLALIDDDNPVRNLLDHVHNMRTVENGFATIGQLPHDLFDQHNGVGI